MSASDWTSQSRFINDRWFKAYWDLRSWLARASSLGNPGTALIDPVLADPRSDFDCQLVNLQTAASRLDPPFKFPDAFVNEGRHLAGEVRAVVDAAEPKDNVYQAAIYAMTNWGWNGNHMNDHLLFRGESNVDWSSLQFVPSIFRNSPDETALRKLRRNLDIVAHWFRRSFPDRDDSPDELLAIFQHYGQPTWLLDLTTSVYVALFFASGADEGIGVVYAYSKNELRDYHKLAPEFVPPFRQIKPQFVPRIDRQHGLFLKGGHGWSTRHLVARQLTFKQRPSMQFEDPGLGISKAYLLPDDGDWAWFGRDLGVNFAALETDEPEKSEDKSQFGKLLANFYADKRESARSAPVLEVEMPRPPTWPPQWEELADTARRYFESIGISPADRRDRAAVAIARYHRYLCELPECEFLVRSFHAFVDAMHSMGTDLKSGDIVRVSSLLSPYYARISDGKRSQLQQTLQRLKDETGLAEI